LYQRKQLPFCSWHRGVETPWRCKYRTFMSFLTNSILIWLLLLLFSHYLLNWWWKCWISRTTTTKLSFANFSKKKESANTVKTVLLPMVSMSWDNRIIPFHKTSIMPTRKVQWTEAPNLSLKSKMLINPKPNKITDNIVPKYLKMTNISKAQIILHNKTKKAHLNSK